MKFDASNPIVWYHDGGQKEHKRKKKKKKTSGEKPCNTHLLARSFPNAQVFTTDGPSWWLTFATNTMREEFQRVLEKHSPRFVKFMCPESHCNA
jgi:hypothetical protein